MSTIPLIHTRMKDISKTEFAGTRDVDWYPEYVRYTKKNLSMVDLACDRWASPWQIAQRVVSAVVDVSKLPTYTGNKKKATKISPQIKLLITEFYMSEPGVVQLPIWPGLSVLFLSLFLCLWISLALCLYVALSHSHSVSVCVNVFVLRISVCSCICLLVSFPLFHISVSISLCVPLCLCLCLDGTELEMHIDQLVLHQDVVACARADTTQGPLVERIKHNIGLE